MTSLKIREYHSSFQGPISVFAVRWNPWNIFTHVDKLTGSFRPKTFKQQVLSKNYSKSQIISRKILTLTGTTTCKAAHLNRILVDTPGRFACRVPLGPWPCSPAPINLWYAFPPGIRNIWTSASNWWLRIYLSRTQVNNRRLSEQNMSQIGIRIVRNRYK